MSPKNRRHANAATVVQVREARIAYQATGAPIPDARAGSGDESAADVGIQPATVHVGTGSGPLGDGLGPNELGREAQSTDGEVAYGTLGLGAVECLGGDFHIAQGIALDPIVTHRSCIRSLERCGPPHATTGLRTSDPTRTPR